MTSSPIGSDKPFLPPGLGPVSDSKGVSRPSSGRESIENKTQLAAEGKLPPPGAPDLSKRKPQFTPSKGSIGAGKALLDRIADKPSPLSRVANPIAGGEKTSLGKLQSEHEAGMKRLVSQIKKEPSAPPKVDPHKHSGSNHSGLDREVI